MCVDDRRFSLSCKQAEPRSSGQSMGWRRWAQPETRARLRRDRTAPVVERT
jgi:hypothetical protein